MQKIKRENEVPRRCSQNPCFRFYDLFLISINVHMHYFIVFCTTLYLRFGLEHVHKIFDKDSAKAIVSNTKFWLTMSKMLGQH